MKSKIVGIFLAAAMVLGVFAAAGCAGGADPLSAYDADSTVVLEDTSVLATEYGEEDYAYPRSAGETQKVIHTVSLPNDCDGQTLLMATALQGLANRENPSMWLQSKWVVQGFDTLNATQFWLNALDSTYLDGSGSSYYVKEVHGDILELVALYRDKIEGAILYPSRVADRATMCNQWANSSIYGDMAVLNLTAMLAGQYSALPLTEGLLSQVNAYLTDEGMETLGVLADTTEFLRNESGAIISDRGSRTVWYNVYRYALDGAKDGTFRFSEKCISHNGTFNPGHFDYCISQKMFFYNRILDPDATDEERAIEQEIYSLTEENTPVIGVWHLTGSDEENCVMSCNRAGKFFLVTYESWNISWTSALDMVKAEGREEQLTYDPTKTYVALTLSETDNNSYTNFKLPITFQNANRGKFAMTWAMNQGGLELNPNIVQWMNMNMAEGDGYATGESGPGYIRLSAPVEGQKENFYGMANRLAEYLQPSFRTLLNDRLTAMEYAYYMSNVDSVLSGYGGMTDAGSTEFNSGKNNFYFHDTPIFQTICHTYDLSPILTFHYEPGSFYSFGLAGWETDLDRIYATVEQLPDDVVVVTQKQLADLYSQKMDAIFHNVTELSFDTPMTESEMGFLWDSDDFANFSEAAVEGAESYRYGERSNYCVYRFDLAENVNEAVFSLRMAGEYVVKLSVDGKTWDAVAVHEVEGISYEKTAASFELPASMAGKTVYMKISDPTPDDGVGYRFYGMEMTSDQTAWNRAVTFETTADEAFISSGERAESGYRTGDVVYNADFDQSFGALAVAAVATADTKISISADGSNFYDCATTYYAPADGSGGYYVAYIDSNVPGLKIRFSTEGELRSVRMMPVARAGTFSTSPVGYFFNSQYLLTGWNAQKNTSGTSSNVRVGNEEGLTFMFRLGSDAVAPMLEVFAGGLFKVEISADGSAFRTLRTVEPGENVTDPLLFDISDIAKPGGMLYVRFTKSTTVSGAASLYYISLQ